MQWLNKISLGIAGLALLLMTGIGAVDIFSAYVLGWPVPAAYEVSELLMVVVVFMAISSLQAKRMDLAIDLLYARFSQAWKRRVTLLSNTCGLIFFGFVAWQGWLLAAEAVAVREYTQGGYPFPVYPAKLLFACGATLVVLQYCVDTLRTLAGRSSNENAEQAADSEFRPSLE